MIYKLIKDTSLWLGKEKTVIIGNQKAPYEAALTQVVLFEFSDVIATSPIGDTDRPTSTDVPAGGWIDPQ